MRRSGTISGAALVLTLLAACFPYGFAGGGLPSHVKTVAVLPFDNQTPSAALQQEVQTSMRRELQRRLGLRDAPESRADAVLRGTLVRYDVDVPVSYTANTNQATTARRLLQLTVDVELVDQHSGKALWQRKGLVAQGEYDESAEAEGRRRAIERVVNEVVEGAQSQW
jgi:Lipopolysaccharide-assembly